MLKQVKNYCLDSTFQFHYQNGQLDVINYLELVVLEASRISLRCDMGLFIVKGEDLTIQKLLDQEILISGQIHTIEIEESYA